MSANEPSQTAPSRWRLEVFTIHPSQRIYWDLFVFFMIFVAAFEIPYDLLVGWDSSFDDRSIGRRISFGFDLAFVSVFAADMVLNAVTLRERTRSGFWGWRNVAGLVNPKWAPPRTGGVMSIDLDIVREPRAIAIEYFRSPWFLIDLLSTVPWGLLETADPDSQARHLGFLGALRLLRLLRLAHLIRFLRLTKAMVVFERIRRATPDLPSLGRMLLLTVSIPWLAHLHACLFTYFESAANGVTYSSAFGHIFNTFATADGIDLSEPGLELVLSPGGHAVAVSAVLFSILFISAITGSLAAVFTGLDLGRPAQTRVLSTNHTLILGWNATVFSIIQQLCAPDEGPDPDEIILVSDRPVEDVWQAMEEFGSEIDAARFTPVQGSISSSNNLLELGLGRAKQVLILGNSPDEEVGAVDPDEAERAVDALGVQVLKTLLACGQTIQRYYPDKPHRWAQLLQRKSDTLPVVVAVRTPQLVRDLRAGIPRQFLARLSIEIVDVEDFVARCLAQIVHEPFMAPVFEELFSYTDPDAATEDDEPIPESAEIYTVPVRPALVGKRFDALRFGWHKAIPIGYLTPASDRSSGSGLAALGVDRELECVLNPEIDSPAGRHAMQEDDRLVMVAKSRAAAAAAPEDRKGPKPPDAFDAPVIGAEPRQVLVLGSGAKARRTARLLPEFLPRGSRVLTELDGLQDSHGVSFAKFAGWQGQGESFADLDDEAPQEQSWDTVVIIADHESREEHDARVLMSLARLQGRANHKPEKPFDVVTALFDPYNRELAGAFGSLAAIISSAVAANYLVQLGSDAHRGQVFSELLSPDGSEIYANPARRYAEVGEGAVSFETVAARASRLGEAAIGFLVFDELTRRPVRRVLCPSGTERTQALIDPAKDRIVVLAAEPTHRLVAS